MLNSNKEIEEISIDELCEVRGGVGGQMETFNAKLGRSLYDSQTRQRVYYSCCDNDWGDYCYWRKISDNSEVGSTITAPQGSLIVHNNSSTEMAPDFI
jgi:hypothetical protein